MSGELETAREIIHIQKQSLTINSSILSTLLAMSWYLSFLTGRHLLSSSTPCIRHPHVHTSNGLQPTACKKPSTMNKTDPDHS